MLFHLPFSQLLALLTDPGPRVRDSTSPSPSSVGHIRRPCSPSSGQPCPLSNTAMPCLLYLLQSVGTVPNDTSTLLLLSSVLSSAASPALFHAHVVICLLAASVCSVFITFLYLKSKDFLSQTCKSQIFATVCGRDYFFTLLLNPRFILLLLFAYVRM